LLPPPPSRVAGYDRTHPVFNGSVLGPVPPANASVYVRPAAPLYVCAGTSGGLPENVFIEPPPVWSAVRHNGVFGYGRLEAAAAQTRGDDHVLNYTQLGMFGQAVDWFQLRKEPAAARGEQAARSMVAAVRGEAAARAEAAMRGVVAAVNGEEAVRGEAAVHGAVAAHDATSARVDSVRGIGGSIAGAPAAAAALRGPPANVSILAYGGVGDGKTDNTAAFAAAVAAVTAAGGGILSVPAGRFLTGPVSLASGMTLFIAPGATLLGGTDFASWPLVPALPSFPGDGPRYAPLLGGVGLADVRITGGGTVDAQGLVWYASGHQLKGQRPHALELNNCTRVEVDALTIVNSAFWTL